MLCFLSPGQGHCAFIVLLTINSRRTSGFSHYCLGDGWVSTARIDSCIIPLPLYIDLTLTLYFNIYIPCLQQNSTKFYSKPGMSNLALDTGFNLLFTVTTWRFYRTEYNGLLLTWLKRNNLIEKILSKIVLHTWYNAQPCCHLKRQLFKTASYPVK